LGLVTIATSSFSGYRELGFDKVLFVEGATDIKSVQQLLRLYGKDHRIVCMDLGGNALINGHSGIELEELKQVPHASHYPCLELRRCVMVERERRGRLGFPARTVGTPTNRGKVRR
jgi:hypothetical protein